MIENLNDLNPCKRTGIEIIKPAFFKLNKSDIDKENFFKSYQHDENIKLSVSKLTEDQVKSSEMYHRLLTRISDMEQARPRLDETHANVFKI